MFSHILFPTDLSDMSREAFTSAVEIARKFGGKITMLNVHEEFMSESEMQYLRVSAEHYKEMMREKAVRSRERMEDLIADEKAGDICEVILREGAPRKEILDTASGIGASCIVMASNGRSNLKEVLIGSVAEHIIRHSEIPVLVVKSA
jgi:nucleotide-binding universal stress UspA family protein